MVLQLLVIGVDRVDDFDYLSPPSPDALLRALQGLLALGCLEAQVRMQAVRGRPWHLILSDLACPPVSPPPACCQSTTPVLTSHGRRVASLPLDPLFAHLLWQAVSLGCVSEALTAVAMLSAENVLFFPPPGPPPPPPTCMHACLCVPDSETGGG